MAIMPEMKVRSHCGAVLNFPFNQGVLRGSKDVVRPKEKYYIYLSMSQKKSDLYSVQKLGFTQYYALSCIISNREMLLHKDCKSLIRLCMNIFCIIYMHMSIF